WIKENVKNFGGDPSRITLFGESAGAAGVSSHLFARGSWDYFNNIILQSGSITAPWATKSAEDATNNGKRLASLCRCNRTSEREMIECLKKVPASELQNAAEKIDVGVMEFPFTAVAKDKHFFQGDVDELFKTGQFKKTALLMGSNSDEGTFWLPSYFREYFDNKNDGLIDRHQFDKSVDRAFGKLPKILRNSLSYHYQSTSNVTHFKNSVDNRPFYRDALKRMMGDYYFSCDVMDVAERLADRGSTVYVYYFTERSSTNPWPKWMGVMHAYEIEYVFGVPIRKPQDYTPTETIFSRHIIAYWTNFAKNG
uniref:Carboxylic ester hydrolase n=1 Tax=Romanomermis culicivorax TaxID=13658 RepID=A0A915KJX6_ROMCU